MAFGAVKPLFAARCTNGDLGVEDVFTELWSVPVHVVVGERVFEKSAYHMMYERRQSERCKSTRGLEGRSEISGVTQGVKSNGVACVHG